MGIRKISYKLKKLMSQSQLNKFKYKIKKAFIYALPDPFKKPARLIFSLIGLWLYFKMMINLTGNTYLIIARDFIVHIYTSLISVTKPAYVNLAIILFLALLLVRYIAPVIDDDKEFKSKSIYREVNGIINLLFFLITVVPIITLFIG